MKKIMSANEINIYHTRRFWTNDINPATKIFKSKKTYSRKDKSWKKDI